MGAIGSCFPRDRDPVGSDEDEDEETALVAAAKLHNKLSDMSVDKIRGALLRLPVDTRKAVIVSAAGPTMLRYVPVNALNTLVSSLAGRVDAAGNVRFRCEWMSEADAINGLNELTPNARHAVKQKLTDDQVTDILTRADPHDIRMLADDTAVFIRETHPDAFKSDASK